MTKPLPLTLFAPGFFLLSAALSAQTVCPPTPQYTPCDLVFDLSGADSAQPFDLHAEFQSPRHVTALVRAFWDGGTKWVIRYTPTEAGEHVFRLTGKDFTGKQGTFTATARATTGWLRAANLHHFANVEGNTLTPHLWMGAIIDKFSAMDSAAWKTLVDTRTGQHFNHLGVTLIDDAASANLRSPEFFRAVEDKLRYANQRGVLVDISFFGPDALMERLLPARQARAQWFEMAISRLAPFDVTWQGLEGWETYPHGRALLKEMGEYLTAADPWKHTRGTRAQATSAPVADDGWLRIRSYEAVDDAAMAIDQQMLQYPATANFGAGTADAATFRHRLWNATASGLYPHTVVPNEEAAMTMKAWYEFMDSTRHWELEPFGDSPQARGVALDGVEYVLYVDTPGAVTVNVEKHTYDVEWINPATGERLRQKEKNKGEVFNGSTPDNTHDWILHISREGHKAGMLKSIKFDSREESLKLQDIEGNPAKVPFEITAPAGDTLLLSKPAEFGVKLLRQSKALERMMYEWTAEVTVSGKSWRLAGTGPTGTLRIPADIADNFPAALHLRLFGMNAFGKVYLADRNYTLTK